MPTTAIDLFCGVGGMTHGFFKERFQIVAGVDSDPTCKFAYEANNPGSLFLLRDVDKLGIDDLLSLYPEKGHRVLIGCAPCQPFSRYTSKGSRDTKWQLLRSFARLAVGVRPDVVSMENVVPLEGHSVFAEFVSRLTDVGYTVTHFKVNVSKYGVPQRRVRLVLFASLHGRVDLKNPEPATSAPTLRAAIGHLPPVAAGEVSSSDPLHRARGLSAINLERIRATPEGGGWADWPAHLTLDCHNKPSGKTFRSVYGRLRWDAPSTVITTQCIGLGNGRFGHPNQDRALTLREAALIQTFPEDYAFVDPVKKKVSANTIARQIGNAVPVNLGRVIAKSIRTHLEGVGVD